LEPLDHEAYRQEWSALLAARKIELRRFLGCGGEANVFEAMHHHLHGPCAVKVFHRPAKSEDLPRGFKEQMRLIKARFRSDRVVMTLDYFIEGGFLFAVSDLAEGSLGSVARERKASGESRFSRDECFIYVRDAAEGLGDLHEFGATHGDVKPGNLFLFADGRVKVGDLGLVRQAGASTLHTAGESPRYVVPEYSGRTPRRDLIALILTYLEIRTGQHPCGDDDETILENLALRKWRKDLNIDADERAILWNAWINPESALKNDEGGPTRIQEWFSQLDPSPESESFETNISGSNVGSWPLYSIGLAAISVAVLAFTVLLNKSRADDAALVQQELIATSKRQADFEHLLRRLNEIRDVGLTTEQIRQANLTALLREFDRAEEAIRNDSSGAMADEALSDLGESVDNLELTIKTSTTVELTRLLTNLKRFDKSRVSPSERQELASSIDLLEHQHLIEVRDSVGAVSGARSAQLRIQKQLKSLHTTAESLDIRRQDQLDSVQGYLNDSQELSLSLRNYEQFSLQSDLNAAVDQLKVAGAILSKNAWYDEEEVDRLMKAGKTIDQLEETIKELGSIAEWIQTSAKNSLNAAQEQNAENTELRKLYAALRDPANKGYELSQRRAAAAALKNPEMLGQYRTYWYFADRLKIEKYFEDRSVELENQIGRILRVEKDFHHGAKTARELAAEITHLSGTVPLISALQSIDAFCKQVAKNGPHKQPIHKLMLENRYSLRFPPRDSRVPSVPSNWTMDNLHVQRDYVTTRMGGKKAKLEIEIPEGREIFGEFDFVLEIPVLNVYAGPVSVRLSGGEHWIRFDFELGRLPNSGFYKQNRLSLATSSSQSMSDVATYFMDPKIHSGGKRSHPLAPFVLRRIGDSVELTGARINRKLSVKAPPANAMLDKILIQIESPAPYGSIGPNTYVRINGIRLRPNN